MGKISDMTVQKRNKSRLNVFIDGQFACGIDRVTALSAGIAIGDELTPSELAKLVFDSEVNSAFERAVAYLSRVPHSRKEVRLYLFGKGYDRNVVEAALKKLDSYKYTDDRAYAELYIKSKSAKYGNFRLAAELRQKGVDEAIIDELLGNSGEYALMLAQKYMRTHRGADVNKLKRYLASHGYSWDTIADAVSAISDEFFAEADD